MALPIRLVVQFTPFPPGFQGDLNKFCRAFADRLEILSPFAGLTWQIGGIKPTSNVGPWLNDLGQPWVWNETLKDYVPMDLSLSLAGVEADVAAAQAAIVAFTALVGSYSTTAQMNAAIAAAAAGVAYPVTAHVMSQTLPIDDSDHTALMLRAFDPQLGFDDATHSYIVPVRGYYQVSVQSSYINCTGDVANFTHWLRIMRNGVDSAQAASTSNNGTGTGQTGVATITGLVEWLAGDVITISALGGDGVDVGTFDANVFFSAFLVYKV